MLELLLKPVFVFNGLAEKLKVKMVGSKILPLKLALLLSLFFVQIFQAVFCLPAYIFIDSEVFEKSGKNQHLTQNDYGFRRFFILTIFMMIVLAFAATYISASFFTKAPEANQIVLNYCTNSLGGWDMFFAYYSYLSLIIFAIGASFFVFLMVKLGILSGKKSSHEA